MGIKNFLVEKLVKNKLKGLPKDQQEMIIALVTKNPELFKKINNEVKQKKKEGMDEQLAMMQVMRSHQGEIQKLMVDFQQSK